MGVARDHLSPGPARPDPRPRAPSPPPRRVRSPTAQRSTTPHTHTHTARRPPPRSPLPAAPSPRLPRIPSPRPPGSAAPDRPASPAPTRPGPPASPPPAPVPPRPCSPALLTGGSRSRCRGSRRPARGSRAAAGLRPGRGTGSRWPAPTRRGSSTPRAGGEPASSCAAALGDPEPGREDRRERTRGRTEPAAPAGSRARQPESERSPAGSWKFLGGAPTPHQGRLFKFGEVGSAPSKGAWGFFVNPRRSAAEEEPVAAEPGVREPRARKARPCSRVRAHTL